jgi:hypothetical protein
MKFTVVKKESFDVEFNVAAIFLSLFMCKYTIHSVLRIQIRTYPHYFWSAGSGSALGIRIRNPKPMRIRNTAYTYVCIWTVFAIAAMSLVNLPLLLFQELTEYELAPVVYNPGNYKY